MGLTMANLATNGDMDIEFVKDSPERPGVIHLHMSDLRCELTIQEFGELARTLCRAARELRRIKRFGTTFNAAADHRNDL